jgi:16S rRNA (cytidine1402-2'-O)-methyltransferase
VAEASERSAPGRLFVVATPIGNLGDVSPRAAEALRSVDLIAAEDTRRTRKLLSHLDASGRMIAYHDHNEDRASARLVDLLLAGSDVALVTDAGTPLVADPGYRLVAACAARGIAVVAIPGPSAVTAALSIAGLPTQPFHFAGYLPRKRAARLRRLNEIADLPCTVVFFESPHRIAASVRDMRDALGDRPAVLARELTKVHEEVLRGSLSDICRAAESRELRGEIVVLVGRGSGSEQVDT